MSWQEARTVQHPVKVVFQEKIEKKKRLNNFNLIKNLILLLIWKSKICQKDKQEKNLKKWS